MRKPKLVASKLAWALCLFMLLTAPFLAGSVQAGPPLYLLLAGALQLLLLLGLGRRAQTSSLDLSLLGLWGWCSLSLIWTENRYDTWQQMALFAMYLQLYFSIRIHAQTDRQRLQCIMAGWAAVVAIGSMVGPTLVPTLLFFGNSNHLGGYLAPMFWLCLALALNQPKQLKFIWYAAAGYCLVAIIWSDARGALLGLLGGATLLIAVFVLRSRLSKAFASITLFALLGSLVLMPAFPSALLNGLESRLEIWRGALDLVQAHPWLGSGAGTFETVYPPHQTDFYADKVVNHAHNDYLEIWVELGTPALLLALMAVSLLLLKAWQATREAATRTSAIENACLLAASATWLVHGFVEYNGHVPANGIMAATCAGLLLQPTKSSPAGTKSKVAGPTLRVWRRFAWLSTLIVILLLVRVPIAELLLKQAQKAIAAGDNAAAQSILNQVLWLAQNATAYEIRGDLYQGEAEKLTDSDGERKRLGDEALAAYEQARRLKPQHAHLHTKVAFLLEQRRPERAGAAFQMAVNAAPTTSFVSFNLASWYQNQGQPAQALPHYGRYLQLRPDGLDQVLRRMEKIPAANELRQLMPPVARTHVALAKHLLSQDREEEALEAWQQAYRLGPTAKTAEDHLQVLWQQKRYDQLEVEAQKYLGEYPDRAEILVFMARAHEFQGRALLAETLLVESIVRLKENSWLYLALAACLERQGRDQESQVLLEKALERYPVFHQLHFTIANKYYSLGQISRALTHYREAANLDPNRFTYRLRLAEVYERTGLPQLALPLYRACLAQKPDHAFSKNRIETLTSAPDAMRSRP